MFGMIILPCMLNRAQTNTRFARILARLQNYSNIMKVFGYATNDFGVLIFYSLTAKVTLVIQ